MNDVKGYFINCQKVYETPEEAKLAFIDELEQIANLHPKDTYYWRRVPSLEKYNDFESEKQGWIYTGRVTILRLSLIHI